MEATRLIGRLGEELVLCTRVVPSVKLARWLSSVEQTMKTSVQLALEACLHARLDDGQISLLQNCYSEDNL